MGKFSMSKSSSRDLPYFSDVADNKDDLISIFHGSLDIFKHLANELCKSLIFAGTSPA